ncbi:TetR/AcrR family transcriptional regulator [Gordonia sp. X0973]|uniref:TetR/AcrR family transcriptional regulator n=1 Tax=Gordonia sp. X0973 TaxID=2742602 RepID=UPI000F537BBC|nr:TetR/AcrR family transcriptional regulator [Gordonia sp. X0973]QKT07964.1 TetR/AcrR family transcriptional regulator [Gordonia sp. X0973]
MSTPAPTGGRPRRRRGSDQSPRDRILDAATEVATECGYDGTTIARVSKRAGVSATSIYWQFADKDELLAAVIGRSYERWAATIDLPESRARDRALEIGRHVASALTRSPDFLRLGLKLALLGADQRPSGHEIYMHSREFEFERFAALIRDADPTLSERGVNLVTTYAIAGADGLFIAREIGGDAVDFVALFELHARLVFGAAIEVVAADERAAGSSDGSP